MFPSTQPVTSYPNRSFLFALCAATLFVPTGMRADLSLETETARVLEPGHFELSMAGEYQHSRDGGEFALPLALEVGLLPRLELLIEPVPYVGIYPKGEKKIHGVGDVEVTATFLVLPERDYLPAIAIAAEVKAPTARKTAIGTKATDYAFYLIGSKRFGPLDVHANVAYTVLGKPSGVSVKNTWSFALAGDYKINPKWDVFGEVMYITSGRGSSNDNGSGDTADAGNVTAVKTSGEGGDSLTSGTAIAEIGGVEIIGTLGVRHHLTEHVDVFGSFSYDNADAKLFRTGFTVKF